MNDNVNKPEKATQNRIIQLFTHQLGYSWLGNFQDRVNENIIIPLLDESLQEQGYTREEINRAFDQLNDSQRCRGRSLYEANKAMYSLLRYGMQVKNDISSPHKTVLPIDWNDPEANRFSLAE